VADLQTHVVNSPIYFPQLADGGGYTTTLLLLNTSNSAQSGTIAVFDDNGTPLSVREAGGITASTFAYSISAGGAFVFQTAGATPATRTGWIQVTPSAGSSSPAGAGCLFLHEQRNPRDRIRSSRCDPHYECLDLCR
jgi:hypothetical protein